MIVLANKSRRGGLEPQVGSSPALAAALAAVRCPVCEDPLAQDGRQLRCVRGHCFDIARQGYVNLAVGGRPTANADTPAMVAARERFLERGHYAPIAAALAALAARLAPGHGDRGLVLDLAGGTGYYLAAVLEALPDRVGVTVDLSKPALRRAAAAHSRALALGADVWRRVPLAGGSSAIVTSVFGPRNPGETIRLLAEDGAFLLVTPAASHLAEVIGPLGMLSIDAAKADRIAARMTGLDLVASEPISYQVPLMHADLSDLVSMGPSAHHVDPAQLARRVGSLPEPLPVTVCVNLSAYRRA
jgi:23S rRNA (guanine745-N1)-methyltransferase